jgi:DNA-directed RNA polymerase specialized sigma24 family protein
VIELSKGRIISKKIKQMANTKEIIRLLVETDIPYKEIAEKCDCTVGGVNYWVKRIKNSDITMMPRKNGGRKPLSIKELL